MPLVARIRLSRSTVSSTERLLAMLTMPFGARTGDATESLPGLCSGALALGQRGFDCGNEIFKLERSVMPVALDEERGRAIHTATHAAAKIGLDARLELAGLQRLRQCRLG